MAETSALHHREIDFTPILNGNPFLQTGTLSLYLIRTSINLTRISTHLSKNSNTSVKWNSKRSIISSAFLTRTWLIQWRMDKVPPNLASHIRQNRTERSAAMSLLTIENRLRFKPTQLRSRWSKTLSIRLAYSNPTCSTCEPIQLSPSATQLWNDFRKR